MAISIPTLDTLQSQVLAYFRTRFPGRDLGTESFLGKASRATAMALFGLYKAVEDADHDATPSANTSTDALDTWAEILGLDDGDDGYGRRGAVAATGGVVEATGTNGTVITSGLTGLAEDGVTQVEVTGGPYTISSGTATVTINAVTEGEDGNLAEDEVVTWQSPPSGVDSTADVTTELSGGEDEESDSDLLERILNRLQNPPKGGTANDYNVWAEEIEGIGTAYIFPRRSGTGTVDVVVLQSGSGQSRRVTDADTIAAVQEALNNQRPVCVEDVNVMTGYMPDANALTIRVRVVPNTGFEFDWDDTAAAYPTVLSYPSTTSVEINGAAPTALINAISAGDQPRIQIGGTGASAPVKAQSVRVTAINQVPANDILTVDTVLVGTAVNGDVIYAGGPAVSQIQTDILAWIDENLGPSRASGLADTVNPWEANLQIGKLIHLAIDAENSSGEKYCADVVFSGTTPQATINGSVADYNPTDTVANGPEVAYAELILVTQ